MWRTHRESPVSVLLDEFPQRECSRVTSSQTKRQDTTHPRNFPVPAKGSCSPVPTMQARCACCMSHKWSYAVCPFHVFHLESFQRLCVWDRPHSRLSAHCYVVVCYVGVSRFVCAPEDEHLGNFCFGATTNNVAGNILVCVFCWTTGSISDWGHTGNFSLKGWFQPERLYQLILHRSPACATSLPTLGIFILEQCTHVCLFCSLPSPLIPPPPEMLPFGFWQSCKSNSVKE